MFEMRSEPVRNVYKKNSKREERNEKSQLWFLMPYAGKYILQNVMNKNNYRQCLFMLRFVFAKTYFLIEKYLLDL